MKNIILIMIAMLVSGCGIQDDVDDIKKNSEQQMADLIYVVRYQGVYDGALSASYPMYLIRGFTEEQALKAAQSSAAEITANVMYSDEDSLGEVLHTSKPTETK